MNKLICGDCLKVMRDMPSDSVDLVLTSPPYNKTGFRCGKKGHSNNYVADIDYEGFNDNLPEEIYWKNQNNLFAEVYRLLKPSGSFLYNHQIRRHKNKAHHPITEIKTQLIFYQQIIWDRCGSFNNNLRYLDINTEIILWYVKGKPFVDKNIKHRNEIWHIPPSKNKKHPASFPDELAENCIQLACPIGGLVLDPYVGSGTTCVVAEKLGRKHIGIDVSKKYIKLSRKRLVEAKKSLK